MESILDSIKLVYEMVMKRKNAEREAIASKLRAKFPKSVQPYITANDSKDYQLCTSSFSAAKLFIKLTLVEGITVLFFFNKHYDLISAESRYIKNDTRQINEFNDIEDCLADGYAKVLMLTADEKKRSDEIFNNYNF